MRGLAAFFVAALSVASAFFYQEAGSKPLFIAGEDAGYLPPSACGACHRAILIVKPILEHVVPPEGFRGHSNPPFVAH